MIKKIALLLLLSLLVPAFTVDAPVRAAAGPEITKSTVEVVYPSAINFSLSAESGSPIEDVRLHYYVERLSYARITAEIFLDITPGTQITVNWSWDMRKTGGFPSGTIIHYWWSLKDTAGELFVSDPESVRFDDSRFEWEKIRNNNITLFWYDRKRSFAEDLLDAATGGLENLYESTGVDFTDPVEIYIYSNSEDLQTALIYPQEWTGGVAYPAYGKIAIGIADTNFEWGLSAIVHELTHLVIHRMTDNPYLAIPTWLDEGLAMYMEGPLTGVFKYYLNKFMDNDALFTVQSLVSPFSAYADQSYLSYAESYHIVNLLITRYGSNKMLEFLTEMKMAAGYDESLLKVYGFDMEELNTMFMEHMESVAAGQEEDDR